MFFKFMRGACPRVECHKKGEKEVSIIDREEKERHVRRKERKQTHTCESELVWYIGLCVLSYDANVSLYPPSTCSHCEAFVSPRYTLTHTRTYYESMELEEERKVRLDETGYT